jgi:hypothetical protein
VFTEMDLSLRSFAALIELLSSTKNLLFTSLLMPALGIMQRILAPPAMALITAGVATPTASTEPDPSAARLCGPPGESPSDWMRMLFPLKNPRASAISKLGTKPGSFRYRMTNGFASGAPARAGSAPKCRQIIASTTEDTI